MEHYTGISYYVIILLIIPRSHQSIKQPVSYAVSFSPVSSRLSPRLPEAGGSLISLLFCPPRASDSARPAPLVFLFCLSRQLYLLASSGPVSQPHLRCPSASGLANHARERIPKPPHLLQVLEHMGVLDPPGTRFPGPGSALDRTISAVTCNFLLGTPGQKESLGGRILGVGTQPFLTSFLTRPTLQGTPPAQRGADFLPDQELFIQGVHFSFLHTHPPSSEHIPS